LEKKEFEILIERLRYWNESEEGINSHGTDSPIFEVKEKVRVYGYDSDYSDYFEFGKDDCYHDSVSDFLESIDEDQEDYIIKTINEWWESYFGKKIKSLKEVPENSLLDSLIDLCDYRKVYYNEDWKHVNSHLTREAAQAFINRKKHDYRELRIWVDSLYWCWEFKDLIKGLVSGEIVLKEK
jgi:hypothetical protein